MLPKRCHVLEVRQRNHFRNLFLKLWLLLEVFKFSELEASGKKPLPGLVLWHMPTLCPSHADRYLNKCVNIHLTSLAYCPTHYGLALIHNNAELMNIERNAKRLSKRRCVETTPGTE
jgi:hypothetical protein